MHIVLALLGTIATILVLLNRLAEAGIDLGGLNPYLWNRRRKWQKQYQGNPLYQIESPLDATAILMVAIAKADGDLTREDKQNLLRLFEKEFHLSKKDAAGLLISSTHLLGDGVELRSNLIKFLKPSKENFSNDQAQSAVRMVSAMSAGDTSPHENAAAVIAAVEHELGAKPAEKSTW